MTSDQTVKPTIVKIQRTPHGEGNAGSEKQYAVTYTPDMVTVTNDDVLLAYYLSEDTPNDFVFVGFTETPHQGQPLQMAQPPALSAKARKMAIFDADSNTGYLKISLTFKFLDKKTGSSFTSDPQVGNDGRA